MSDLGRLQKEISDFKKGADASGEQANELVKCFSTILVILRDPPTSLSLSGITLETDSSDPRHFIGVLMGPSDTPYSGGVYRVDITIPTDYPFGPPKMKFITKVHLT